MLKSLVGLVFFGGSMFDVLLVRLVNMISGIVATLIAINVVNVANRIVAGFATGGGAVPAPPPAPSPSPLQASFVVFAGEGGKYYVKDASGSIVFVDTDARKAIQYALDSLTPNRTWKEKITVFGDYIIDNSASPLHIGSYTIFELHGKLTALDNKKTLVYVNGTDIEIRGGIYNGNSTEVTTADEPVRVIHIENSVDVIVENVKVVNGYGRGIEISNGYHVTLKNIYAENNWRNIMVWSDSYSTIRNHVLLNIHSKRARGGSGVDLGTVGYVVIDELFSEEDNPVALAIDSCKCIIARNIISKYRGILLIFAGYNHTENIVIENAVCAGSGAGALLAEIKSSYNITDLVLKNIKVLSPIDTAIALMRTAGVGVIDDVRIYDIYTDGIPADKYSVVADNSVQFIEVIGGRVDRPMNIDAVSLRIRDVRGYDI
jgi:hypothetical protein